MRWLVGAKGIENVVWKARAFVSWVALAVQENSKGGKLGGLDLGQFRDPGQFVGND